MRLNSKQICTYTGGSMIIEPIDASELACGISWDSRKISPGDVYVALPGEQVDGHRFIADALRAGASIVLVTDKPDAETCLLAREMGAAIIEVSNTAAAITDLARAWRRSLQGHVIALTGSSGKTTTKNLIRDVLKASFSVVATEGNQNNELGVPNTLLSADPETQAVVVEMGMRGIGQIAELCDFVLPDMGLITNVGEGHIELLGSRENIARAKAELLQALPDGYGKAFLNRDDEHAAFMGELACLSERNVQLIWYDGSEKACGRVKRDAAPRNGGDDAEGRPRQSADIGEASAEGRGPDGSDRSAEGRGPDGSDRSAEGCGSDAGDSVYGEGGGGFEAACFPRWGAWAEGVELDSQGRPVFILHIGDEARRCVVPLRGAHNATNAVAAASVGNALGMDIDTIVAALEKTEPECGRQEVLATREGITVIHDAYNANPDSMRAALMTFSAMEVVGRRIAVLGDMGELGDFAEACHIGIGELVADLPIDYLICIGGLSAGIVCGAERNGFPSDKIRHVDSVSEVLVELEGYGAPGDAVLVKASHYMGLERVVGGLVN